MKIMILIVVLLTSGYFTLQYFKQSIDMGKNEKLLVIGRHQDMMDKITGKLRQNGYDPTSAITNEEAIEKFKTIVFDAVVIGGGVDQESRTLFKETFKSINPKIIIIDAHPSTIFKELEKAFNNDN